MEFLINKQTLNNKKILKEVMKTFEDILFYLKSLTQFNQITKIQYRKSK